MEEKHPIIEYLELLHKYCENIYKTITNNAELLEHEFIDEFIEDYEKSVKIAASNRNIIEVARNKLTLLQNRENTKTLISNANDFKDQSAHLRSKLSKLGSNYKFNSKQINYIEQLCNAIYLLWIDIMDEMIQYEEISDNKSFKIIEKIIINGYMNSQWIAEQLEQSPSNFNIRYIEYLKECKPYDIFYGENMKK